MEVGKHAESRLQRLATLEIVGVLAFPPKALALGPLHTRPVDAARGQTLELVVGIVLPYDPDDLNGIQDRPSDAEIDCRTAQRVRGLSKWSKDRVQRDTADNE